MIHTRTLGISVFVVVSALAAQAGAQLQSVDEALAISKKTGRPIFAVAGQAT